MKMKNKIIIRMGFIAFVSLIVIILSVYFIIVRNSNTINECDASCLQDYVVCLNDFDVCKTTCWKDYNKYMNDNQEMCREFEGQTICQDRSDKDLRRSMALSSKECEEKCNDNLEICEREHKDCANRIRECVLNVNER